MKAPGDFADPLAAGSASRIMGIVNLTPDSFSDGGRYSNPAAAIDHALRLEDEGASVIDLGSVSTRPGADFVSEDEELRRLLPVVEVLAHKLAVPMSIDTFRPRVFAAAHAAGAAILNDVSALGEGDEMIAVLVATGAPCILMHMQGNPRTMQLAPTYGDVVADVVAFFRTRLERAQADGLEAERFVLDPGLGFGKSVAHNLALIARVEELSRLGRPLCYGASRKSFLGKILDRTDPSERECATSATTAHLAQARVKYLRVHDVRAAADVVKVIREIENSRVESATH